jgi:hypothetical protein
MTHIKKNGNSNEYNFKVVKRSYANDSERERDMSIKLQRLINVMSESENVRKIGGIKS